MADGFDDVHVHAHDFVALFVLKGREIRIGTHDQLTVGNEIQARAGLPLQAAREPASIKDAVPRDRIFKNRFICSPPSSKLNNSIL